MTFRLQSPRVIGAKSLEQDLSITIVQKNKLFSITIVQVKPPEMKWKPTTTTTPQTPHPDGVPLPIPAAAFGALQAENLPPVTLKSRDWNDKHEAHALPYSWVPLAEF